MPGVPKLKGTKELRKEHLLHHLIEGHRLRLQKEEHLRGLQKEEHRLRLQKEEHHLHLQREGHHLHLQKEELLRHNLSKIGVAEHKLQKEAGGAEINLILGKGAGK